MPFSNCINGLIKKFHISFPVSVVSIFAKALMISVCNIKHLKT